MPFARRHGAPTTPSSPRLARTGNYGCGTWQSGLEILRQDGPDGSVEFSDDLSRIAAVDNRSGQLTIYRCKVCGADIERLEELAAEQITRAPTEQERELYLDR